jgi:hypothetical protein
MSRQLPRLTNAATGIEHNPIWRRIPAGILQLITGVTIFTIVYSVLNFIY